MLVALSQAASAAGSLRSHNPTNAEPVAVGRRVLRVLFAILATAYPSALSGGSPLLTGTGRLPAGALGITVHNVNAEGEYDAIKAAGFSVVRSDLMWEYSEEKKGQYDFSRPIQRAKAMHARGLRPLFILDYGNALYSPVVQVKGARGPTKKAAAPATEEARAAYAAWAAAAAKALAAYDPIWEIWNEPEHDNSWAPKANAESYAKLVSAACIAIKRASADAPVIAGAFANPPSTLNPRPQHMLALGRSEGARCVDAVSLHPYAWSAKIQDSYKLWKSADQLTSGDLGNGRGITYVNSEWGVSTAQPGGVSEHEQAARLTKIAVTGLENRLALNVLYEWKDAKNAPKDLEEGFGIMDGRLQPKPAYFAIRQFSTELGSYRYFARCDVGGVTAIMLRNGQQTKMVAWANSPKSYRFSIGAANAKQVRTMLGGAVRDVGGVVLNADPVYLDLGTLSPTAAKSTCGSSAASAE